MERSAPPRIPVAATGLLSLALGLFLALLAFGAFYGLGTFRAEGPYCSKFGIGEPELNSPETRMVVYEGTWSTFPPQERCRVYAVNTRFARVDLSTAEMVRRDGAPDRALREETHPSDIEFAIVVAILALPPTLWVLLVLAPARSLVRTSLLPLASS